MIPSQPSQNKERIEQAIQRVNMERARKLNESQTQIIQQPKPEMIRSVPFIKEYMHDSFWLRH